jgi:nicotinic acid mononucleotide adenylyltransferase
MSGSQAAAMEATGSRKRVVFTFQGAFGPPTYGHYMSMKNFAKQISQDYPSDQNEVTMLFMPGGHGGSSKTHLYPTQADRKAVLDVFCEMLKKDFPSLTFETSGIEYGIVNEPGGPKPNPSTIITINTLKTTYPDATILVGMGLDNMFELPFWTSIDEYAQKCEKIYVVDRELSDDEKRMVKPCIIQNESSGEAGGGGDVAAAAPAAGDEPAADKTNQVVIKIKASIPTWWNGNDKQEITNAMAEKLGILEKCVKKGDLNNAMSVSEKFEYKGQLPKIVIIEQSVDMRIPGTSSTLLRKLIASFNAPGVEEIPKDQLKQMIQTMMFGPVVGDPKSFKSLTGGVLDQTISGYLRESLERPQSKLSPADIEKILKTATVDDFDTYNKLFPGPGGGGGAGADAGGGYRKKTRKNKKKSTKKRLRKVNMNSRNLRMKKKRSRSRK